MDQYTHQNLTQDELETIFFEGGSKYNTSVELNDEDKKNGFKILCKEPYAQEFYNALNSINVSRKVNKDLEEGNIYKVVATTISYQRSEIYANELLTGTKVCIPFK